MSRRDAAWLAEPVPEKRFGLKGPRAAELLQQLQLAVPEKPNTWAPLAGAAGADPWNVVARLGSSEFFIEGRDTAPQVTALDDDAGEQSAVVAHDGARACGLPSHVEEHAR